MRRIRTLGSLGLALAVTYGVGAGLNWDQWQPIGWLVIIGGSGLWLTTPGGITRIDALFAFVPSALFLLGFTAFRWQRPIWQVVDFATISCFIIVAYLAYTQRPKTVGPSRENLRETPQTDTRDQELRFALRAMRADLAGDQPRYVVFTDKTLEALVKMKPTDFTQLARVYGIGPSKAAKYGTKILNTINSHVERTSPQRSK